MKTLPFAAAVALLTLAVSVPAHAARPVETCPQWRCGFNGVSFNGFTLNGFKMNGLQFNGRNLNDIKWNGLTLNGKLFNGVSETGAAASDTPTVTAVRLPARR